MEPDSSETTALSQENRSREDRVGLARVCVIVLNWNGWRDTLECLESLRRVNGHDVRVIVVDNGSTDRSCDKILEWIRDHDEDGTDNSSAARQKDGSVVLYAASRFVVIEAGANGGYAAGNNVGIRWALANTDSRYIWILNNDCVLEPGSLSAMVKVMEADPGLQICGATICSYYDKNRVLMHGGAHLSHITFHSTPVLLKANDRIQQAARQRLSYISGACMLARRSLFERIGLLSERYFLFFEEPDLMERAGQDCELGVAFDAVIYHKEGRATGSVMVTRLKSASADYYSFRSRLLFVSKFYPHRLWLAWLELPVYAVARLVVGRPANTQAILKAGRDYLRLKRSSAALHGAL